jgi:hypothetical protein
LLDGTARDLDVLGNHGVADLLNRQAVRVQLLDVNDDVDFTRPSTANLHLTDAIHRLDRPLHLLVGDLGQGPKAHRVGRNQDGHHRI